MKLRQMQNNQIEVIEKDFSLFFSYGTLVAMKKEGEIILDKYYWTYSPTTLKYLKAFLRVSYTKKEIQQKIDDGIYLTKDLQKLNIKLNTEDI